MIDKFLDEIIQTLMPTVSIISPIEAKEFRRWTKDKIHIDFCKYIVWDNHPQNIQIKDHSEIIAALESLLQTPFSTVTKTVYVMTPGSFPTILKTEVDLVLKNYSSMFWAEEMWVWNPTEGYVIEDLSFGRITVGLVQKCQDPHASTLPLKQSALQSFSRLTKFLHHFTAQANTTFLPDDKANKILSFFQSKFPLTPAEKIDWDKIEKKVTVSRDPGKIIPTLEQLLEKPMSMTAYINWCDPSLPLVKIDLQNAIARYAQIVAVARETVIFNPTARYVIEINGLGDITVGVLTQHKD